MKPLQIFPWLIIFCGLTLAACSPSAPATEAAASATPLLPAASSTPAPSPIPSETVIPPTPTLDVGSVLVSTQDGATLVYIPAGEFVMGSADGEANEKPVHTVYLEAFWIDRTEVTNRQYELCVAAGVCQPPSSNHSFLQAENCFGKKCIYPFEYYGASQYAEYPVIYVSWEQAKTYCAWTGRVLPTEAQWEKAARGPEGAIYPWGNAEPNGALLNYNSIVGDTTRVGSYPVGQSPYGAYDMAGNVWEWVNDWYSGSYYQNSPASNPLGPEKGDGRVLRGRSLGSYGGYSVRASYRYWGYPNDAGQGDVGFRCALNAAP